MISNYFFGMRIARRSTRRWIVSTFWCYALLMAGALTVHQMHHGLTAIAGYWMFFILLILTPWLGGVRVGGLVKPFRGAHFVPVQGRPEIQPLFSPMKKADGMLDQRDFDLDERETLDRDQCHFLAYTVVRWSALALLALYCGLGIGKPELLAMLGPLFLYLLTLALWSLPQSILLWTEPDMEAMQ